MEDSKSVNVEDLIKTLSILKKALINEREERKTTTKSVENLQINIAYIEKKIAEKVINIKNNQITIIVHATDHARAEIMAQERIVASQPQNKPKSPTKQNASSRSVLALEQQNDKLLEEYEQMKKENEEIETKIKTVKQ